MREDLKSGNPFPDFSLPNTMKEMVTLSEYMGGMPTVVTFNRGNYCPKDRRQLLNYATDFQPDRIVAIETEGKFLNTVETIEDSERIGVAIDHGRTSVEAEVIQ